MLSPPTPERGARPGAFAIVAALAAVLAVCLVPADRCLAQWPPWARSEPAPDPVYPDITVDASWLADHLRDAGLVIVDARDAGSFLAGLYRMRDPAPFLAVTSVYGARQRVIEADRFDAQE